MNNYNWPKKIVVSGLPFMLQGWNNTYVRNDLLGVVIDVSTKYSDDVPIYTLESYWLYGIIPIASVQILRVNGEWILRRLDNKEIFAYNLSTKNAVQLTRVNGKTILIDPDNSTTKNDVDALLGPWNCISVAIDNRD